MTHTKAPQFGPYTPIVQAGSMYFVSGQVGVDPATKQARTGIAEQTKQAITNLQNVLTLHGLKLEHVVKTTVYLTNMDDYSIMNEVYCTYFTDHPPARAAVAVKELPRVGGDIELCVEIEAVAVLS